jgi:hypothetical protein
LNIKIKDTDNKSSSKEFKDEYIIIAIDSTGIKVTNNRGPQWMREKWHIKNKKGHLKIHICSSKCKDQARKSFPLK